MSNSPSLTTVSDRGQISFIPNEPFQRQCAAIIDNTLRQIENALAPSIPLEHPDYLRTAVLIYFKSRGVGDDPDYSQAEGLLRELLGWSLEPSWPTEPRTLRLHIEDKIRERGGH